MIGKHLVPISYLVLSVCQRHFTSGIVIPILWDGPLWDVSLQDSPLCGIPTWYLGSSCSFFIEKGFSQNDQNSSTLLWTDLHILEPNALCCNHSNLESEAH